MDKDYPALIRKLAAGKPLAQAAVESGLSDEDAKAYLQSRADEDSESLRAFADEALKVSLRVLKKLSTGDKRESSSSCDMGATGWESTDLKAATALLRAGMEARKMLRQVDKKRDPKADLFDALGGLAASAWDFKEPD